MNATKTHQWKKVETKIHHVTGDSWKIHEKNLYIDHLGPFIISKTHMNDYPTNPSTNLLSYWSHFIDQILGVLGDLNRAI